MSPRVVLDATSTGRDLTHGHLMQTRAIHPLPPREAWQYLIGCLRVCFGQWQISALCSATQRGFSSISAIPGWVSLSHVKLLLLG